MPPEPLLKSIEIKDRTGRVIGTKEVVTYPGLLSKAHEEGLTSIRTTLVQIPSDENDRTAIATAEISTGKGTFHALGDASPESVTNFLIPHLIRMAETRAKARALRDAVNIGVVSFEELDGEEPSSGSSDHGSGASNGAATTQGAPPTQNGKQPAMTESQRRYLFRILAGWGFSGDSANEYLKDKLGVETVIGLTKFEATKLIDRMLLNPPQKAPTHGEHQPQ